ncbi:MAG: hypothetical protein GON13_01215 [Nanoarchaeota archaeon]|nr:hypothetical protein [Nanoarchaeota archaeon]
MKAALNPKHLWHGSISKNKVLKPKMAVDLTGHPDSNLKGVYATDIKELAIEFGLADKKLHKYADYTKNPVQLVLIEGNIRIGKKFYLHRIKSENFKEMPKNSHQWFSHKEIKPAEIIELKVDDYKHLVRKASKKDKEYYYSMIGKFLKEND